MTRGTAARATVTRLPSLTGLRFAAALLVFGVHAYSFIPVTGLAKDVAHRLFDPGDLGVSFFFVLSGFVLTWAVRGGPAGAPAGTGRAPGAPGRAAGAPGPAPGRGLGRFWAGRFLRIYPAYLVALVLAIGGKYVGDLVDPAANRMNQVNERSLGTSLLLVQAWFRDDITYLGINPVAWSLSCEIAFYASFPLLYALLRRVPATPVGRFPAPTLYACAAAFVAAGYAMPALADPLVGEEHHRWFVYIFPVTRAVEFALGITLALLVRHGAWRGPGLRLATVLFVANYFAVHVLPQGVRDTAAVLATTALLIPAAALADLRGEPSTWRRPSLVALGDASYAFFLVHLTVLTLGMTYVGRDEPLHPVTAAALALAFLVVSYALAFPLHYWVERPAMRLLGARRPRTEQPAPPSDQPAPSVERPGYEVVRP